MRSHSRRSVIVGALAMLALMSTSLPAGAAIDPGSCTVKQRDLLIADGNPGLGGGSVGCGRGKRVVTGGAYWHQPDQGPDPAVEGYLRISTPDGDAKGWYAAGFNDQTALRFTVVALCLPTGSFGRYTVRTMDVPIADGDATTAELSCGSGKRAAGGGAFWRRPGEGRDATLAAYLRGSYPDTRGRRWYGVGQNLADADLLLRIVVLCLPS